MGLRHVRGERLGRKERIVDVRVQLVALVTIDDLGAGGRNRVNRHDGGVVVIVPPVPVLFVEHLHRRDQQAEVEVQLLAGRHASRSGVGAHHDLLALLVDIAAAPAAVAPIPVRRRSP